MKDLYEKYQEYLPPLKEEQKEMLSFYFQKLFEEAMPLGFVGRVHEEETLFVRHIVDSYLPLQVEAVKKVFEEEEEFLDIGTGAGLPGIPLAILFPQKKWLLLDSSSKKILWLDSILNKLSLPSVSLLQTPISKFAHPPVSCALIRAFLKPLMNLEVTLKVLKEGGKILYWRSRPFDRVPEARERILELGYNMEYFPLKPPKVLPRRGIYIFTREKPPQKRYPRSMRKMRKDPLIQWVK